MGSILRPPLLRRDYIRAARRYCASLPLEHFMEATPQGRQREITLESLALVSARRPDVQLFNELLIQYPRGRARDIRQVVPDNMIVVYDQPIRANESYDLPFEPVGPRMVLEYVSKNSKRKDYKDSFQKYERELKVPYYLTFDVDMQDLRLHRHDGRKYVLTKPNEHGRLPVPDLELEVAILDGWLRYWFRGELLPLPAELQQRLDEARRQLALDKQRADEQTRRADEQEHRADELHRQVQQEQQAREAAQREAAELRAQLERSRKKRKKGR